MNEGKRKSNKGVAKAVIRLITVVVIVCAVAFVVIMVKEASQPKITNTFISNKLEAVSELTATKMTYNGLIRYSDGKIPLLTKKAFTMTYRARVRAGIDLSKVETKITNSKVEITVPEIEILDISIDTDSIQFYDEKSALFNGESKDDALEAIDTAKKDVMENGDVEELKATAKEQTEVLLEGLFKDSIGDRTLEINYKN